MSQNVKSRVKAVASSNDSTIELLSVSFSLRGKRAGASGHIAVTTSVLMFQV